MTRNGKKKKKRGNDTDGFDRIQTRINEKNKTREQAKKKKGGGKGEKNDNRREKNVEGRASMQTDVRFSYLLAKMRKRDVPSVVVF